MKGEHALLFQGSASTQLQHKSVRDLLGKLIKVAGFTVSFESGGGQPGQMGLGDMRIKKWIDNKDFLIHVTVIHPLCESHIDDLVKRAGVQK